MIINGPPAPHGRGLKPEGIIVHAMGEFIALSTGAVHACQFLPSRGLSAHVYVTPSGDEIEQIPPTKRAFHAGRWNGTHLGLEVLVPGAHTLPTLYDAMEGPWVPELAWCAAVERVRRWLDACGLGPEAVERHSDKDPARKRDPGIGFDWPRFVAAISR